jgi:DNA polymerase-4
VRGPEQAPRVVAQETLARDTNVGPELAARVARLAAEVGFGLRARGEGARQLELTVVYADGRDGRARCSPAHPVCTEADLGTAALALLDRAFTRRVRVRRLVLHAWGIAPYALQLPLWNSPEVFSGVGPAASPAVLPRDAALEAARDRVRARFGASALIPASWIAQGLALRPPARP